MANGRKEHIDEFGHIFLSTQANENHGQTVRVCTQLVYLFPIDCEHKLDIRTW